MEGEDALPDSGAMAEHANGVRERNWDFDAGSDSESKQSDGNREAVLKSSVVETEAAAITSGAKKSSPSKKLPGKVSVPASPANEKLNNHKAGMGAVRKSKDAKVAADAASHTSNISSTLSGDSKLASHWFSVANSKGSSNNGHATEDDGEVENLGKSSSTSSITKALQSQGVKDRSKLKPLKRDLPLKVEEDALSCSSPTAGGSEPPRVGNTPTYSFNFRCNERAEKRKEFYTKLVEKNIAKEAERNSLQAKCKETQEAELRLLRKSMTFRATPMPSFYQEPPPPKVELKKIPPTRARSPKLGRHKSSNAAGEENTPISSRMGRLSLDETKTSNGSLQSGKDQKKPQRRSLPKLPSEKLKDLKLDSNASNISSNVDANTTVEVGKNDIEQPAAHKESEMELVQESDPKPDVDPEISEKAVVSMQC